MRNSLLSRSYKMLAQIKLAKRGIEKQKTNATATIIETNHKTKFHANIQIDSTYIYNEIELVAQS